MHHEQEQAEFACNSLSYCSSPLCLRRERTTTTIPCWRIEEWDNHNPILGHPLHDLDIGLRGLLGWLGARCSMWSHKIHARDHNTTHTKCSLHIKPHEFGSERDVPLISQNKDWKLATYHIFLLCLQSWKALGICQICRNHGAKWA